MEINLKQQHRESSRTPKAGATRRWDPRGQEQAARTTAWGECGNWDPREFTPAGAEAVSTGSCCQLWRCPQSSEAGGQTLISPHLSLAHFCPASHWPELPGSQVHRGLQIVVSPPSRAEQRKAEGGSSREERAQPSTGCGNLQGGRAGRGKPPGGGPQRTARPGCTPDPSAQGSWKSPLGKDKELQVETSCFTVTVPCFLLSGNPAMLLGGYQS